MISEGENHSADAFDRFIGVNIEDKNCVRMPVYTFYCCRGCIVMYVIAVYICNRPVAADNDFRKNHIFRSFVCCCWLMD